MKPRKLLPYYIDLFSFFASKDKFNVEITKKSHITAYYRYLIYSKDSGYILHGEEYEFIAKVLTVYNDKFVHGANIIIADDAYNYKCLHFFDVEKNEYVDFSLSKSINKYYEGKYSITRTSVEKNGVIIYLKGEDKTTITTEFMNKQNFIDYITLTGYHTYIYHPRIKRIEGETKLDYASRLYDTLLTNEYIKGYEKEIPKIFLYLNRI